MTKAMTTPSPVPLTDEGLSELIDRAPIGAEEVTDAIAVLKAYNMDYIALLLTKLSTNVSIACASQNDTALLRKILAYLRDISGGAETDPFAAVKQLHEVVAAAKAWAKLYEERAAVMDMIDAERVLCKAISALGRDGR